MSYAVKELFRTIQGEGFQAGRVAVFCRFSGCNLWSGREQDRASAQCRFCDTDFVGVDGGGGGKFADAGALAAAIEEVWGDRGEGRFVVFTGGEPLLQLDDALLSQVHDRGFEVAVETNGTIEAPDAIDWICVSPKAGTELRQKRGSELKVVYPQSGLDPTDLINLEFEHFWVQPLDGPERAANTEAAIAFCFEHPSWRLSVQSHKLVGIR